MFAAERPIAAPYSAPVRPSVLLAVAVGGVLGAMTRVGIGEAFFPTDPEIAPNGLDFPWATLIVNIAGCLLIGLANPLLQSWASRPTPAWTAARMEWVRSFIVVGFLGGFTTFSALAAETWLIAGDQAIGLALVYLLATVVGGLLAVAVGSTLAQTMRGRAGEST